MAREIGLTRKQARFCAEYVKDLNGTRAAIAAGYSPTSARRMASQLLQIPHVKAEVVEREQAQLKAAGISAELVLEQIRRIATFDIASIYDYRTVEVLVEDCRLGICRCEQLGRKDHARQPQNVRIMRHPADWPPEARTALANYETVIKNLTTGDGIVDTVVKVKMHDKLQALEMLAKHLGILTEKVETDHTVRIQWEMPEPPPEVETIDAPKLLGPPPVQDWRPGEDLECQEEMGFRAAAPAPALRTRAHTVFGLEGGLSSSVEPDPNEEIGESGLSRRAQERMFPELRNRGR